MLGEYAKTDITVEAGKKIDLGKLDWQPVRYGKQIWEIGYPDRTGDKFFKGDGDNYWLWGWGLRYCRPLPQRHHLHHRQEQYPKDWFFQEVPHSTTTAWLNPAAKDPYNQRFGWVDIPATTEDPWPQWGQGRATTWTVKFNMPKASQGTAVLRIALAGADGGGNLATRRRWTGPADVGGLTEVALCRLGYARRADHRRQRTDRRHHPSGRHQRSALQHQTRACGTSTSRSSTPP